MPWCPKCRDEYRDGFLHCGKCGTLLVNALEDSADNKKQSPHRFVPRRSDEKFLTNIMDPVAFSYLISLFEENGIFYRVMDAEVGLHLQIIHGRSFYGKDIYVDASNYQTALEILASYKAAILPGEGWDTPGESLNDENHWVKKLIFGLLLLVILIIF